MFDYQEKLTNILESVKSVCESFPEDKNEAIKHGLKLLMHYKKVLCHYNDEQSVNDFVQKIENEMKGVV